MSLYLETFLRYPVALKILFCVSSIQLVAIPLAAHHCLRHLRGADRAGWLVAIIFIPILGPFWYLTYGADEQRKDRDEDLTR